MTTVTLCLALINAKEMEMKGIVHQLQVISQNTKIPMKRMRGNMRTSSSWPGREAETWKIWLLITALES